MSNPTVFGYLERPYLVDDYLVGVAYMAYGMQTTQVISSSKTLGMQTTMVIASSKKLGMQTTQIINGTKKVGSQTSQIINSAKDLGTQATMVIASSKKLGMQTTMVINAKKPSGMQTTQVISSSKTSGMQTTQVISANKSIGMQAYLISGATTARGSQVQRVISGSVAEASEVQRTISSTVSSGSQVQRAISAAIARGMQISATINSHPSQGSQVSRFISGISGTKASSAKHDTMAHWMISGYLERPYLEDPYLTGFMGGQSGMQVARTIRNFPAPRGMQISATIHAANKYGSQVQRVINAKKSTGFQVTMVEAQKYGMQATMVLYNATNLRILSEFPSRGSNGLTWVASSTAPGDFSANNLNTDIVEQQWRSAPGVTSSITLDNDSQTTQVFIDTFCMFNHNLTTSAVVVMQGSAVSNFSVIGETISFVMTRSNFYYIAPTLPTTGYRYRRILINDPTNPDGQIKIGTIVYGAARILQGDNITDQVTRRMVHFSDKVSTEGFTDVQNDRALKFAVGVSFKNLDYNRGNYTTLDSVFQLARTSLKCVWIPDPQVPQRFSVFGKMRQIPDSVHNHLGVDASYVDLAVEVDESL